MCNVASHNDKLLHLTVEAKNCVENMIKLSNSTDNEQVNMGLNFIQMILERETEVCIPNLKTCFFPMYPR